MTLPITMNTFQTMLFHFAGRQYRENENLCKNPLQFYVDLLWTTALVVTAAQMV